jgi:hypothetical protein
MAFNVQLETAPDPIKLAEDKRLKQNHVMTLKISSQARET